MVTHRWWGNKFCKRTCKGAYLRELALGRDKIRRRYAFFSRSRQQAKHAVIVTSEPASSVCAAHPSTVAEKRRWSVLRPAMPPGWKGGRLARRLHYGAGQIFLCLWYTA